MYRDCIGPGSAPSAPPQGFALEGKESTTEQSAIQLRSAASKVAASCTVQLRQASRRDASSAPRTPVARSDSRASARAYTPTRSCSSARSARRTDGRSSGHWARMRSIARSSARPSSTASKERTQAAALRASAARFRASSNGKKNCDWSVPPLRRDEPSARSARVSSGSSPYSRSRAVRTSSVSPSTLCSENHPHHGVRAGKVGKDRERFVFRQLFDQITSGRDSDGLRAERASAGEIGGRVADDENRVSRDIHAEVAQRAGTGNRRQLRAQLVIGAERADAEARGSDTDGLQLRLGSLLEIARQQAENYVRSRLERIEQLGHAGKRVGTMLRIAQLLVQTLQVSRQQPLHVRVDALVTMTGHSHQLAHDLRVRLAVKVIVGGARTSEDLAQRPVNGAPPGSVGQEERSVDVEQNELHVSAEACTRVSSTPVTIVAAPSPCHAVGLSPSVSQATIRAISG